MRQRFRAMRGAGLGCLALVSACSGGGGGSDSGKGVVIAPSGPTASTPAPSPAAEQLEDQRSNAASFAQAEAAYRMGFTGRGVKIAVLDTGIAPGVREFAGRIDPASADVAGTRGLVDTSGHGTMMASVALAARDGQGMHGVAYEATLVSLNFSNPASCTGLTACTFLSAGLIAGIDAAIAAKVRVINLSFSIDQSYDVFEEAVRRAAAAGIVTVISAGNSDGDPRQPLLMARAFAQAAPGWVIIAGGVDATGTFAFDRANQAGTGADAAWYLTALFKDVNMVGPDGLLVQHDGTSPAAAAISGAIALVAQARPSLTGAQIVTLLLANATDAGAPGRDPVCGNGVLNIAKTFAALPPVR
jgi:subtilisin family serine protease